MDPIILSAIKKAKKELEERHQVSAQTLDDLKSALTDLKDTKLPRWVQDILDKVDQSTDSTGTTLSQLKSSLESKLSPWTGTRAAKLDKLDTTVSSRADGSYYTPARASKLDKLDKLDTTVSSRLSRVEFAQQNEAWDVVWGEVLNDLKKLSAEYRDRIAAVLGQMDVAGLSTEDSIKLLTQYLEDIPIIGAASSTLTTQGSSYTIPRGYHNGKGSVRTNITNLRPENIAYGVNVGGVVGNLSMPKITEHKVTFTDSEINRGNWTIITNSFTAAKPICLITFDNHGKAFDELSLIEETRGAIFPQNNFIIQGKNVYVDGYTPKIRSLYFELNRWVEFSPDDQEYRRLAIQFRDNYRSFRMRYTLRGGDSDYRNRNFAKTVENKLFDKLSWGVWY